MPEVMNRNALALYLLWSKNSGPGDLEFRPQVVKDSGPSSSGHCRWRGDPHRFAVRFQ
jgi:hypothetical protein